MISEIFSMMYYTSWMPKHKGSARESGANGRSTCLAIRDERIAGPRLAEARDQTGSGRVARRGDDLFGVAAGDFGHALELAREAAGPRGRRAQFDDEIADL